MEWWETQWASPDFDPPWRVRAIPREIRQAAEGGWFPEGVRILDIGCGTGEIAAWLARQGYAVTGVDLAPSAIARARASYGDEPGLRFEVDDICDPRDRGTFEAFLDRGCLQWLREGTEQYMASVEAASAPGARFLLVHAIDPQTDAIQTIERVESLFKESFVVERTAEVVLASFYARTMKGVVVWMSRA